MVGVDVLDREAELLGLLAERGPVDAGLGRQLDQDAALVVADGERVLVDVHAACPGLLSDGRSDCGHQPAEAVAERGSHLLGRLGGVAAVVVVVGSRVVLPATTIAPASPAAQRRLVIPADPFPAATPP